MLLCGDPDSLLSILISLIRPESQILPSSPPGSHNNHRWRPSSEGNLRSSFVYLPWVIIKVALSFYVGILTRFLTILMALINNNIYFELNYELIEVSPQQLS